MTPTTKPWYRTLTSYHWLVLAVCTLGWTFDCLDQQLFALARTPALGELIGTAETDPIVAKYAGYATSLMLIGWAIGGIIFGILGDKLGRAKTMVWTILFYSLFTGLCSLSVGVWDFLLYRFLTGLGIGGQFAVGVSLVAETMPTNARSRALGLLQAVAALGNIAAAMLALGFGQLEAQGILPSSAWRWMFAVGAVPAVLSVIVMLKLHEPEQWQTDVGSNTSGKKAGSIAELFGVPWLRRRVILGMLLASVGVIGLWGIGFFAIDLNRAVIRRSAEKTAMQESQGTLDMQFVAAVIRRPDLLPTDAKEPLIKPKVLLATDGQTDAIRHIYQTVLDMQAKSEAISHAQVAKRSTALSQKEEENPEKAKKKAELIAKLLPKLESTTDVPSEKTSLEAIALKLNTRQTEIDSRVSRWGGMTSLLFNLGAFFGIYIFAITAERIGRRPTFTIAFIAALASTATTFLMMDSLADALWMVPIMGFCQLSIFGGYAVYFPELFPTRLRSTSVSFCYNIGRLVAALGPYALGLLTSKVFAGFAEPMRYAGATMSFIFLFGVVIIWFMPETRGQPLPD